MDKKVGRHKSPVMLLFFNRPECLQQVFDAVKNYEPEELFLVQDGAREGREDDIENVRKCREIVEKIDWKCTVYRNYADENMSCDHREYTGIAWCFQYVDRLIILEDDCVPSQSFMRLCEECLEKYKDDAHIHSIYGFNRIGDYDCPYDYVFSKSGAGWGWATWKRVWDRVELVRNAHLSDDSDYLQYMDRVSKENTDVVYRNFISEYRKLRNREERMGKVLSWEQWVGLTLAVYDMVTIAPKHNLIHYIGISENATHTMTDPRCLPYKVRRVLFCKVHEIEGEINHPPFEYRDKVFEKLSANCMKYPPYIDRIEVGIRKIWYQRLWKKR